MAQSTWRLPSTSSSSAPSPRATKIGSRPIERIARTGELTPPGGSSRARRYSSADLKRGAQPGRWPGEHGSLFLSVLRFPLLVLVREVEKAGLLELGRGVERAPVLDAGEFGDRVEDGVALILGAAVGHGEDRVGPILVGRPLVAVRDAAEGRHPRRQLHDPLLGD